MSWIITGAGADPQLLDAYPGAAAAYSLRDLSWAYGGPVVRVRRSSDNTEQDFTAAQITDGTLTTFCGAGDGFVRTWYDQSGNSNHAVQATASLQPKIVSSGSLVLEGGKPALLWENVAGMSLVPPMNTLAANAGFFFVTKHDDTGSFWSWIIGEKTSGNFFIGKRDGSSTAHYSFAGVGGVDIPGTNIAQHAVSYWQRGSQKIYRINNSSGTLVTSDSNIPFRIGCRGGIPSEVWIGRIQEVLYYENDKSSDAVSIQSAINAHYGIF